MSESSYLLVRCDPGLPEARVALLFHAFAHYPGVKCVFDADLTGLPQDRLDVLTGRQYEPGERRPAVVRLAEA